MQKREAFLGKKVDAELAKAKECSKKKDKRGALMALKRKKLFEKVRASFFLLFLGAFCHAGAHCPVPSPRLSSVLTPPGRVACLLVFTGDVAVAKHCLSAGAADDDA